MKNRNASMDIAKAIAMLFIIITHVLQRTLPGYVDGWGSSVLLVLGVPVFFFLSGTSHGERNTLKPLGFLIDILKRGFAYFLPVIWFLSFRVWIYGQWSDFSTAFSAFIDNPSYGLWVLWVLLWIVILLDIGLLIPSKNKYAKKGICTVFIVVGYITMIILRNTWVIYHDMFIGYDLFVYYTPFFVLGMWVGDIWNKKRVWPLEASFLFVGLLTVILTSVFNQSFIRMNKMDNLPLYYGACTGGVLTVIGLSGLLSRMKWSKALAFAGQFTLEAYFLHLMLLKNWAPWDPGSNGMIFLISLGLTLLCITNTAAVCAITYFIPFSHFALFGRSRSFYKFEQKAFKFIGDKRKA